MYCTPIVYPFKRDYLNMYTGLEYVNQSLMLHVILANHSSCFKKQYLYCIITQKLYFRWIIIWILSLFISPWWQVFTHTVQTDISVGHPFGVDICFNQYVINIKQTFLCMKWPDKLYRLCFYALSTDGASLTCSVQTTSNCCYGSTHARSVPMLVYGYFPKKYPCMKTAMVPCYLC